MARSRACVTMLATDPGLLGTTQPGRSQQPERDEVVAEQPHGLDESGSLPLVVETAL